ncbi:hypothetical protein DIPPA_65128 [Diplonema papillatum]|nr:hypothetical protein DIPPA_65128 [Diplonema papillatum]
MTLLIRGLCIACCFESVRAAVCGSTVVQNVLGCTVEGITDSTCSCLRRKTPDEFKTAGLSSCCVQLNETCIPVLLTRTECQIANLPSNTCNYDDLPVPAEHVGTGTGCFAGGAVSVGSECILMKDGKSCTTSFCQFGLIWLMEPSKCVTQEPCKFNDLNNPDQIESITAGCVRNEKLTHATECRFSCGDLHTETTTCNDGEWSKPHICSTTLAPVPPSTPAPTLICERVTCAETDCLKPECNQVSGLCDMAKPDGTSCSEGTSHVCQSGSCVERDSESGTNITVIIVLGVLGLLILVLCVALWCWKFPSHLSALEMEEELSTKKKKRPVPILSYESSSEEMNEPVPPSIVRKVEKVSAPLEVAMSLRGKLGIKVSCSHVDRQLSLAGVMPDSNAEAAGLLRYIGRQIVHANGYPVSTEEDFFDYIYKSLGHEAIIGFEAPKIAKDAIVEVHSLNDGRGFDGERGRIAELFPHTVNVRLPRKGLINIPKSNIRLLEGSSAATCLESEIGNLVNSGSGFSGVVIPPKPPNELVIQKGRGEALGIRLDAHMVVHGASLTGTAVCEREICHFLGRRIVAIDNDMVASPEEAAEKARLKETVVVTFGDEERVDPDGSIITLDDCTRAYGKNGIMRWATATKLNEFFPYGQGPGRRQRPFSQSSRENTSRRDLALPSLVTPFESPPDNASHSPYSLPINLPNEGPASSKSGQRPQQQSYHARRKSLPMTHTAQQVMSPASPSQNQHPSPSKAAKMLTSQAAPSQLGMSGSFSGASATSAEEHRGSSAQGYNRMLR